MERFKEYLLLNFEQVFVFVILLAVALISYWIPQKIAFLNFFFLPVIISGYFLGLRHSILGAFFCICFVSIYTIIYPHAAQNRLRFGTDV